MNLEWSCRDLRLAHPWRIARTLGGPPREDEVAQVVVVRLEGEGGYGWGEAAPSLRYQETPETVQAFLARIDPARLSFRDVEASRRHLDTLGPAHNAARGALDVALWDGVARLAGQPVYDFLKLGFREDVHFTSFSIGIDTPEMVRRKTEAASGFPILKLKLGGPQDAENLAALRSVAPEVTLRVDANEAWKTKEEALRRIERLAEDRHIEFVEQPMPAATSPEDQAWLRARSPLPLVADESCLGVGDVSRCRDGFHGVNVKLVKTAGLSGAYRTLQAARQAGLKTMIGCMVETSILITAAAHLAELADHLDIDGSLLITNDPFEGASTRRGRVSFHGAPELVGLRVRPRPA